MSTESIAPPQLPRRADKQRIHDNKLSKRLVRQTSHAIADYNMIENGDRVMVCLSGGKDSYGLLDILLTLRSRAPIDFDIIAVNLDQKQHGFPEPVLPECLERLGVPSSEERRGGKRRVGQC